jgi:hypothetical protein
MLQPNFSDQKPRERGRERSIGALVKIFAGAVLIVAGMALGINQRVLTSQSARARSSSPAASVTTPAPRTNADGSAVSSNQRPRDHDQLGLTLEEFQAKYESLSGKPSDQEAFFKNSVGKRVVWTVRVDHVFRVENGVIVVFSSIDRPDWAAFPISDARFPVQFESRLMTLARGETIKMEGKIVYQGIKTLECSNFEIVSSDAPDQAR